MYSAWYFEVISTQNGYANLQDVESTKCMRFIPVRELRFVSKKEIVDQIKLGKLAIPETRVPLHMLDILQG